MLSEVTSHLSESVSLPPPAQAPQTPTGLAPPSTPRRRRPAPRGTPRVTSLPRPSRPGRRVRARGPAQGQRGRCRRRFRLARFRFRFRFRCADGEDMAALGRVSRLLLSAAAPRSPPARGMAAAAHEGGGGNGALRNGGEARAHGAALDSGALRCGNGA